MAEFSRMVLLSSLNTGQYSGSRAAIEKVAGVAPSQPERAPGLLVQTPAAAPDLKPAEEDQPLRRARATVDRRNSILGLSAATDDRLGAP